MSRLNNRKIWAALARTDPKHTKPFRRAGGFSGKSVKPIYTDMKMTEMFGACGIGWGYTMPNFQLVNGPNGSVLVYCTLALWYVDPDSGKRSDPIPGVGGDFAVVKQQSGLRADDEAFKKATTDAIGNAMKHMGMSADIHMGQHDDDKYVTALKAEFAEEELQTEADDLVAEIGDVANLVALSGLWKERQPQINALPADLKEKVTEAKDKRKADLQQPVPQAAE